MTAEQHDHPGTPSIRLLITGARGQLGADLLPAAARLGISAVGLGSTDLDITDRSAVMSAVANFASTSLGGRAVIVNAAAYTAVDAAETDRDTAFAVNATGPENLARAAAAHRVGLIQVSTDYVVPRRCDDTLRGGRPNGSTQRLRGEQARRRAGSHRSKPRCPRRSNGVGLRRDRQQLRQDHGGVGGHPRLHERGRRPAWLADLVRRSGGRPCRTRGRRRPGRGVARHRRWRDQLVRVGQSDLQPSWAPTRNGCVRLTERLSPAGPASGLFRAVGSRLGAGGPDTAARLAIGAGRGVRRRTARN